MIQRITAIVENGHLRPVVPIELPEGTRVEITIEAGPQPVASKLLSQEVRNRIKAIAELPMESGPGFSNRDHDKILYGEKGAR